MGRETALGTCWVGSTLKKSILLFRGDRSVFLPLPFPLSHRLVYCNAAEVQGSFFIHRPMYTLKGGGAGEGSNGASLGKVTLFPLIFKSITVPLILFSGDLSMGSIAAPVVIVRGYGLSREPLMLEQF